MPLIIPRVSPDAEQFEHLATEQSLQDFILRALVLRVLLEAGQARMDWARSWPSR